MAPPKIHAELEQLREQFSGLKQMLGAIQNQNAYIYSQVAPHCVNVDDGLVLAKLKFDDLFMCVDERDQLIGPSIMMNGVYEPNVSNYFRHVAAELNVVVDVGANIGYHTLLFARQLKGRGKVYAFEAEHRNFSILTRNCRINWFYQDTVIAEKLAVSNRAGTIEFFSMPTLPGNSSTVAPGNDPTIPVDRYEVPCTSLDEYFAGRDVAVDLLKVDVEGAEFAVLDGARRVITNSPRLRLLLEWDPVRWGGTSASAEDVREVLSSFGLAPSVIRSPSNLPQPITWEQLMQVPYENILFSRIP